MVPRKYKLPFPLARKAGCRKRGFFILPGLPPKCVRITVPFYIPPLKGTDPMNYQKYTRQYYPVPNAPARWMQKDHIEKAPIWCTRRPARRQPVADRPDEPGRKAGILPAAGQNRALRRSRSDSLRPAKPSMNSCGTLIERNLIPDDVTIQVLTQSQRAHHPQDL